MAGDARLEWPKPAALPVVSMALALFKQSWLIVGTKEVVHAG